MNPRNIFNNSDPSLRSGLQLTWAIWFLLVIHAVTRAGRIYRAL